MNIHLRPSVHLKITVRCWSFDGIGAHDSVPGMISSGVGSDIYDRRVFWQKFSQITGETLGESLEVCVST